MSDEHTTSRSLAPARARQARMHDIGDSVRFEIGNASIRGRVFRARPGQAGFVYDIRTNDDVTIEGISERRLTKSED
jgi:hypothetical protein